MINKNIKTDENTKTYANYGCFYFVCCYDEFQTNK